MVKLFVSQRSLVTRFAFPDNRITITFACRDFGVQAVVGNIGLSADIPFDVAGSTFENFGVGLKPVEFVLANLIPESFGIVFGSVLNFLILFNRTDPSLGGELLGRRKQAVFLHHVVNLA